MLPHVFAIADLIVSLLARELSLPPIEKGRAPSLTGTPVRGAR
jgi:hypothetical protein